MVKLRALASMLASFIVIHGGSSVRAAQGPAATAPGPAAAEDPRSLEARKACAAGEVDRGIRLLTEYLSATDDPTIIYNMGRCYEQNGLVERALLHFKDYLRKAKDLSAEDRHDAEEHIRQLEAQNRRPGDSPPPAPQERGGPSGLRTLGLALGAAGVLAGGTGVVFAFKVSAVNAQLASERAKDHPDGARFTSLINEGRNAETLQWVSLGVGAAALAAAAICYPLSWNRASNDRPQALMGAWRTGDSAGAYLRVTY
jgi:hypothetical protein